MSTVTLEMNATDAGWDWSLRQGAAILARGQAMDADEGIRVARVTLAGLYDAGLEEEICRPFWARSWLGGAAS